MANWIRHYHTNLIVVATKMDKLKKREIEPNLQRIWETLEMGEDDILVPFSTQDDDSSPRWEPKRLSLRKGVTK